ncbi:MAG: triose-phosphate isomerase [Hyphomicrobiaceae bacterium]
MQPTRPLVAGNWKMNGLSSALDEAVRIGEMFSARRRGCDAMICPPATLVKALVGRVAGSGILVGGQDCHPAAKGAHTGDISAEMLADLGASAVIVGHSERRGDHGESDEIVRRKAEAAHRAGLIAIICVGETAGQRTAGLTVPVVARQIRRSVPDGATAANTIIAYEPVWAIGSGMTPTRLDVMIVHQEIRRLMSGRADAAGMRILYGGSVNAGNARDLMSAEDVDGALVGGASLKADDFLGIIAAYDEA